MKKIPMRQCVGCREMKDKKALLRVVKAPDGTVSLDFGGKKPGRGAYVCHDVACLQKAHVVPVHGALLRGQSEQGLFNFPDSWHGATPPSFAEAP